MDEAQLDAMVDEAIDETGASSMTDMVTARTGGQAEGGVVSA